MRPMLVLIAFALAGAASAQTRPATAPKGVAAKPVATKPVAAVPAAKPAVVATAKPAAGKAPAAAGAATPAPVVAAVAQPPIPQALIVSSRSVVANSEADPSLSTFAEWVRSAGLEKTLNGKGPYTVFVPENKAFTALPAQTASSLRDPKNAASLRALLSYHVVPGNFTAANLAEIAKASGSSGMVYLKTLSGDTLNLQKKGNDWVVMDSKGHVGKVRRAAIDQGNGMMYTIDTVLQP